ncbi:hypothetical protein Hanom_Chr11g01014891 [Helianthus anomalus]
MYPNTTSTTKTQYKYTNCKQTTFKTTSIASDIKPNHPPDFCTVVTADSPLPVPAASTATAASAKVYIKLSARLAISAKSTETPSRDETGENPLKLKLMLVDISFVL